MEEVSRPQRQIIIVFGFELVVTNQYTDDVISSIESVYSSNKTLFSQENLTQELLNGLVGHVGTSQKWRDFFYNLLKFKDQGICFAITTFNKTMDIKDYLKNIIKDINQKSDLDYGELCKFIDNDIFLVRENSTKNLDYTTRNSQIQKVLDEYKSTKKDTLIFVDGKKEYMSKAEAALQPKIEKMVTFSPDSKGTHLDKVIERIQRIVVSNDVKIQNTHYSFFEKVASSEDNDVIVSIKDAIEIYKSRIIIDLSINIKFLTELLTTLQSYSHLKNVNNDIIIYYEHRKDFFGDVNTKKRDIEEVLNKFGFTVKEIRQDSKKRKENESSSSQPPSKKQNTENSNTPVNNPFAQIEKAVGYQPFNNGF